MTKDEDPKGVRRPIEGDPAEDRRWVAGALVALFAIFSFFFALSRYELTTDTAGDTSPPQAGMPSAGSSSLPKGPETTGAGSTSASPDPANR